MADALGIVGVIGVAAQIIQIGVRLGQDWKSAPADVRSFLSELQALKLVLTEANDNIVRSSDFRDAFEGSHSTLLSQFGSDAEDHAKPASGGRVLIATCSRELHALLKELQAQARGHQLGWERLKGAFKAAKTREAVQNLYRYCQSLNWMLAIDSLALEVRTHLDIRGMRAEQKVLHKEVMEEQSDWRKEDTKATATVIDNLDHLMREQKESSEATEKHQSEVSKRLPVLDKFIHDDKDEKTRKLITWFSSLPSREKQTFVLKSRHPDTGSFLLESKEFDSWVHGNERILWCIGAPGTGKTVLASAVVSTLETTVASSEVATAYLYCTHGERNNQTIEEMVGSLIQQLLWQRPVPNDTINLYNSHKDFGTRPSLAELSAQLEILSSMFSKVYIVVDALDECPDLNNTRRSLIAHLRKLNSQVRLLFTSRPLGILADLKDASRFSIVSPEEDMRKYISTQIQQEPRLLALCQKHVGLEAEILDQIIAKADGMFLMAKLHIQSIAGQLRLGTVRKALATLPERLNDTYNDTMNRIERGQDTQQSELAMRLLMLLSKSFAVLTLAEVQHALLAMEIAEDEEFDPSDMYASDLLLTICGGLVILEDETSFLRFVHHTAETYFEANSERLFEDADLQLTLACLNYLSLENFASGLCETADELNLRVESFGFYEYSVEFWGDHARKCSNHHDAVMAFLRQTKKVAAATQRLLSDHRYYKPVFGGNNLHATMGSVHLAAYFGLGDVLSTLLGEGQDPGSKDSWGMSPLSWAADRGHTALVKKLLGLGVDVDSKASLKGHECRTPLSFAARSGYADVVELLLEQGADPSSRQQSARLKGAPRWAISKAGDNRRYFIDHLCKETTWLDPRKRFLLKSKGGGSKSPEKNQQVLKENPGRVLGATPLHKAAYGGHETAVRLLLRRDGVEVDCYDNQERTPLSGAAECGHETIVKLLLEEGADPNSHGCSLPPASVLRRDIESNRLYFVDHVQRSTSWNDPRVLFRPGMETHGWISHGATPIGYAAAAGREAVVSMLIAAGANVDWEDHLGRTPLLYAARFGHLGIVRLLLSTENVRVSHTDDWKRTPLDYARGHRHSDVVKDLEEAIARRDAAIELSRAKERSMKRLYARRECLWMYQDRVKSYRLKPSKYRQVKWKRRMASRIRRRERSKEINDAEGGEEDSPQPSV